MTLNDFIGKHRDELISRCRAKAKRSAPQPTAAEIDHGVPLFLDQLRDELLHGPSKTHEISKNARKNGHDQLLQQFSISQVVHGYGDVCQSVTDLAVEVGAAISTNDFRTMNRCLDDAIAAAVTEYAKEQDLARDGESSELRKLANSAISAFEAIQSGNVGVGGSTGKVVLRSLQAIRALADRQHVAIAPRLTGSTP